MLLKCFGFALESRDSKWSLNSESFSQIPANGRGKEGDDEREAKKRFMR